MNPKTVFLVHKVISGDTYYRFKELKKDFAVPGPSQPPAGTSPPLSAGICVTKPLCGRANRVALNPNAPPSHASLVLNTSLVRRAAGREPPT
ncbi:hypothetical protein NDU88_005066 [Pleurodeles waltl]|uniref:Uncharacterized protein n=1 Tax=Pleurodeles waltl TaxID=8319 RepID=A0AAV7KZM2_PLEWA|nr:hypothetical protein NDU88_005066 [Pleurodeles waltl]